MAAHHKALIAALRGELAFIERGGYRKSARAPWRAQFMFEDSPTCLNSDPAKPQRPCSECPLVPFVPEDQREKRIPCRYVPLDEWGETVDSLYRTGTQEELEAAVARWLKTTIERLQRASEPASQEAPTIHVKGKVVALD